MQKNFPTMLDRPETPQVIISVIYCLLAFFSLPFIMLLLMQGSFDNDAVRSGIEIAYHVINFLVAVFVYREYLGESFLNVQIDVKNFLKTVGICVALMFALAWTMFRFFTALGSEMMLTAAMGILPLAEVDLFTLSSWLVLTNPIIGTICLVILAPFTISCLFYSTVFAPICCNRPWLAYLVVALLIAFPRICNGMTYWNPTEELVLYLVQLPMHLMACWSYQKTDTVWAPIAVHASANLLASLLVLLFYR